MLIATAAVLRRHRTGNHSDAPYDDWLYAKTIQKRGTHVDAALLLPLVLEAPERYSAYLPVLEKHGSLATAEALMERCCPGGRLAASMPSRVLRTIGYLGFEPAERMLFEVAQDPLHGPNMDACLGLLALPCRSIREALVVALEEHEGKLSFPEFLPVLAIKDTSSSWLERLVAWGNVASTDCNGGLIVGIAAHGAPARSAFEELLFSPTWQAGAAATGAAAWTYAGARMLGLTMQSVMTLLRARLRNATSLREKCVAFDALNALLAGWLGQPWHAIHGVTDPTESWLTVREVVFRDSADGTNDAAPDLARASLGADDARRVELEELRVEVETRVALELLIEGGEECPEGGQP